MMERILTHPVLGDPKDHSIVEFLFEGEKASGVEGEPVSSALIALGVQVFSFHRKDGTGQGLFCANGQCSQCTVLIDGVPKKACVTNLAEGMDIRRLNGLPLLPSQDEVLCQAERRTIRTDILIVGGGPSGLSAAYELGRMGFQVVVADDKEKLGGKLILQTHKFFGSQEDCHAGVRGIEIATVLESKLKKLPNVTILKNAPVVAIFKDRKAGVYQNYISYLLIEFTALVVATGAREKNILFPGNDLPGIYGAGAFQTLINRDRVMAAKKILVIGSGNVGLITAYHALQAGIQVAGIVEISGKINGYRVHADKIRRLGVPIHLNATILRAEGTDRVLRAIIAQVDDRLAAIPGTAVAYEVDSILIAAGLAPCDEFLSQARSYGILAVAAGDAKEIAEASSAMFGGRIAAHSLAKMLGKRVEINPTWPAISEILKSRPGDSFSRSPVIPEKEWRPVFFCSEEIPCNPCVSVCPVQSIKLKSLRGTIMDLPYFDGTRCTGCGSCLTICPGLAITLVRRIDDAHAELILPWEFPATFEIGTSMELVDQGGSLMCLAALKAKRFHLPSKTWLLTFRVELAKASTIAGARLPNAKECIGESLAASNSVADERKGIVCRCERVSLDEIVEFIVENQVRDVAQLKTLRVGMGACGGKTCSQLLAKAFILAGVDPEEVEASTSRPLFMEVPMGEIVNEGLYRLGGKDAGAKGAP
jgi:NADPH-dependent 2,4-dienoyl-CoA reductase/sulfur reductase-like enzyme/Fe-S-cluster-containing hydrogenase component 2